MIHNYSSLDRMWTLSTLEKLPNHRRISFHLDTDNETAMWPCPLFSIKLDTRLIHDSISCV